MKLGEKIKSARKAKGLTQEALAGSVITRNMLSKIENGVATPSFRTLEYLAKALDLPTAFLCDEESALDSYRKKEIIDEVYTAYSLKKYQFCISRIKKLECLDNELFYILTECYLKEGLVSLKRGALKTAEICFKECEISSKKTVLDTSHLTAKLPMYLAICKNVSSPLLEFEPSEIEDALLSQIELEYLKYLSLELDYPYQKSSLAEHVRAKKEIKARNFHEALKYLNSALDALHNEEYDAYTVFSIYSDFEICYKQLSNYEKAYLYASKKLSLLEGFKS
jgi:transcriptional regulator with XRE-family HTH domain